MGKMEKKRKIVKGNDKNLQWKGERMKMSRGPFFFFYFLFLHFFLFSFLFFSLLFTFLKH